MVRDKVRIRFRKQGDLRLVSHHDLMRCFERMLRRADLPFHSTEGFNPKPRLVFALSLALGIEGLDEVVDLELREELSPETIRERLALQAPEGMEILDVRRIDPKARAQVCAVRYRLPLPAERGDGLAERVAAFVSAREGWVERTRPHPKRLNIRPYLREVRLDGKTLEMDLWVTPQGTARPEEVLRLLGLEDLLGEGAVLQRTTLEFQE